jgi:hypothetical protein
VIEGFQIELTAQQLSAYLRRRADHHREAAAECDLRRGQSGWSDASDSSEPSRPIVACWLRWADELDDDAAQHRRRQAALLFLGEHVVANEIYRLTRSDLQFLEIWPRQDEERRS